LGLVPKCRTTCNLILVPSDPGGCAARWRGDAIASYAGIIQRRRKRKATFGRAGSAPSAMDEQHLAAALTLRGVKTRCGRGGGAGAGLRWSSTRAICAAKDDGVHRAETDPGSLPPLRRTCCE